MRLDIEGVHRRNLEKPQQFEIRMTRHPWQMHAHHPTHALFKSFQVRNTILQQPVPFPDLDRLIVEHIGQIQNKGNLNRWRNY